MCADKDHLPCNTFNNTFWHLENASICWLSTIMTYSQVNNEYVTQVTINFTAWSRELWNSNDYRPYTYGSCDYMSRDEGIRRICMCLPLAGVFVGLRWTMAHQMNDDDRTEPLHCRESWRIQRVCSQAYALQQTFKLLQQLQTASISASVAKQDRQRRRRLQ